MLIRRGTKANQASHCSFPGGKDAVSITPERMAHRILQVKLYSRSQCMVLCIYWVGRVVTQRTQ